MYKKNSKIFVKKIILIIIVVMLAVFLAGLICGYIYSKYLFSSMDNVELDDSDLGIAEETGIYDNNAEKLEGVTNIALFGVDSRDMNATEGRSDAMMVVSLDTVHNKVKLISLERDSYVFVEGVGHTKLTHAYAYGGYQLAIKTINQNFGLDIKDFAAVNFSQLSNIIDYIGGVTVNVSEAERKVLNRYVGELNALGIPAEEVTATGDVHLTGGQAVAYARNRYTGNDFDRMDRQYEVLMAMKDQVLNLNFSKYDDLIKMILSECVTSLKYKEIIPMGYWALKNMPDIERITIPNDECYMHFEMIGGLSYVVYDMENAKNVIKNFIYQ